MKNQLIQGRKAFIRFSLLVLLLAAWPALFAQAQDDAQPISIDNASAVGQIAALEAGAEEVFSVSFNADGSQLASAHTDGGIRLWDVNTLEEPLILPVVEEGKSAVFVSFAPDTLFSMSVKGDVGRTMRQWDIETQENIEIIPQAGEDGLFSRTMAVSPDSQTIATDHCTGQISFGVGGMSCSGLHLMLVDAASGEVLADSGADMAVQVWSIAYSPDSSLIATGCANGKAYLYDAATADQIRVIVSAEYKIYGVTFSPDSTIVAVAMGDGSVSLWDTETGEEVTTVTGHTAPVIDVAFSPDGTVLASAGADNIVQLWNVEIGESVAVLEGHTGPVVDIAFSPDGTLLASGSYDGTVLLWGIPASE